jgi:hypothetical protein
MAKQRKKKITFVTLSCANCYFKRVDRSILILECKLTGKIVAPSSTEMGANYYRIIPDDCPFPDTDEPDQFGE